MPDQKWKAAVITVSDRSSEGTREDLGGPLAADLLEADIYDVVFRETVPDEQALIETVLKKCADELGIALVVTTGGTGFAQRDVTPEATINVCEKLTPGIPEAMRAASMKITNRAMLSRMAAGIRGRSLIINLPGSPKALEENLSAVLPALSHGMEMLRGNDPADCASLPD